MSRNFTITTAQYVTGLLGAARVALLDPKVHVANCSCSSKFILPDLDYPVKVYYNSNLAIYCCYTTISDYNVYAFSQQTVCLAGVTVPGWSSLGSAFCLPVAACCPESPFLLCLLALSASCRALLSAFSSALLLAGLSAAAGASEAGTETGAGGGTAGGAEKHTHHTQMLE